VNSTDYLINPADLKPISKLLMDPNDHNRILAFGENYIYKTTDGGYNWNLIYPFSLTTNDSVYQFEFYKDYNNINRVLKIN